MKIKACAKVPIPTDMRLGKSQERRDDENTKVKDSSNNVYTNKDGRSSLLEHKKIKSENNQFSNIQIAFNNTSKASKAINGTDSGEEPLINLLKKHTSGNSEVNKIQETKMSGVSIIDVPSITLAAVDFRALSKQCIHPSKVDTSNVSISSACISSRDSNPSTDSSLCMSTPPHSIKQMGKLEDPGAVVSVSSKSTDGKGSETKRMCITDHSKDGLDKTPTYNKSPENTIGPLSFTGTVIDPNYQEDSRESSMTSLSTNSNQSFANVRRTGSMTPTNNMFTPSMSPSTLITTRLDSSPETTPTNSHSRHTGSSALNFSKQVDGCIGDRSDVNLYRQPYIPQDFKTFKERVAQEHHDPRIQSFPGELRSNLEVRHMNGEVSYTHIPAARSVPSIQQASLEPYVRQSQEQYSQAGRCETVPRAIVDIDENMAAEQLATELVQTFGGTNSHMITDILKQDEEQQFMYGGFDRQAQMENRSYGEDLSSQQMVHDVDLLNTPQQLPIEDDDYQSSTGYGQQQQYKRLHFGDPQASSTPDRFRRHAGSKLSPQGLQGTFTYNDVHLRGGRWSSAGKRNLYPNPHETFEQSENPCEDLQIEPRLHKHHSNSLQKQSEHLHQPATFSKIQTVLPEKNQHPFMEQSQQQHLDHSNQSYMEKLKQFNVRPQIMEPKRFPLQSRSYNHSSESDEQISNTSQYDGYRSAIEIQGDDHFPKPEHEVTKMTFTPREMMETHLSQNFKLPKQSCDNNVGQPISDMDYSSIYPSREFIERTVGNRLSLAQSKEFHQPRSMYEENPPPKKRHKSTRYETSCYMEPAPPPPMPIFDDMMAKYPPMFSKEEAYRTKHKYFVVNPSDSTDMSSKTLITKYIDFLVLENEQITEISKSPNPPIDIYVTEDMYFMETLKYRVPFPSKKFSEWVSSFYPKLNFREMKFKGRYPKMHCESARKVNDLRSTQQILEDTFYFFQREIMNVD